MNKLILIFFIIIFSFKTLNAEVFKKNEIKGNERISKETIKVYGDIAINEEINSSKINEIIKKLYSTNFFENINISLNKQTLVIEVVEHPVINEIIVTGEKATKFKDAIKENIKSKKNGPFNKSFVAEDEKMIKKLYSTLGFNFLEVNSKIETFSKKRVNVYFELKKGERTNISKINFKGDRKVRDRRLRDIITSQENKFWKILTQNTNLNQKY